MGKPKDGSPVGAVEAAYDRISDLIESEWQALSPSDKMDLALNLAVSMQTQAVRIAMLAGSLTDLGDTFSRGLQDAYREGSANTCPCGECGPIEVTVSIRPITTPPDDDEVPPMDGSGPKPGTMVN